MPGNHADVMICGAGIAGVAAAYHLAVKQGVRNVVVVDERPLLSLTSDKSSECYRNWWPGPGDAMVRLMNRSIDLLEALAAESDNYFHLNRRGYLYLSADAGRAAQMRQATERVAELGAGELRVHRSAGSYQPHSAHGYHNQPNGADFLQGTGLVKQHFPFVADDVAAALHVRRAGWFSAQQLGMYLWEQAKNHGVQLVGGKVVGVGVENGRCSSVTIHHANMETQWQTRHFVNAAGPLLKQVAAMIGVELPIQNELHGKIAIEDPLGIVPRDAPLTIWQDPLTLPWSDEERAFLSESSDTRWLLQAFPPGAHFRPEGGPGSQTLLLLWTYHTETVDPPLWPLHFDPEYAEIVLRGVSRMVPGLAVYTDPIGKFWLDGGYYTKTPENRPLIGPLPVAGAYVIGALSGHGVMAALAAGELLATHVTGGALPAYAPAFALSRYDDPAYQALLANWDAEDGQL
ncbi:MAG: FAD-dependent oxidoreductase [Chloroflexota bacterium]